MVVRGKQDHEEMMGNFRQAVQKIVSVIQFSATSNIELIRFHYFFVFLVLGLPTMLVYGAYSLIYQQYILFGFISVSAVSLLGGWFLLLKYNITGIVYRTTTAIFSCLILYMLLLGGEGGSKILWMYIFPLISFFLFGNKEGSYWNALILLLSLFFLWNPFEWTVVYSYSNEFTARFVTTFVIVSAITYWFEYLRSYYRKDLEDKNIQLHKEIDERIKAEEKLKASEEKLRSWLDYSPVCTKILDCDCTLRFMSSAGIKALKIADINSFYGKTFPLDYYPEPGRTSFKEALQRIQKTGEVIELETPLLDAENNQLWFLSSCRLITDTTGRCDYLMVVSVDITDRKRAEAEQYSLEKQLQQSQKMEAVGTLAGGIAHDFNNILTAILGYAELALYDVPRESEAEDNIKSIVLSSKRAADLVKQLLTYSRKNDMEQNYCTPQLIVAEALNMLKVTLPPSIILKKDIEPHCGTVGVNGIHLHQIVVNLCTNASQAMVDKKGVIQVELENQDVARAQLPPGQNLQAGPFVLLTVSDNGMGIHKKTMPRIFEPYFTTKELGAGTGLGLAVVHGIVQQCDGFIRVESGEGKGTNIGVYLPVVERPESESALPDGSIEPSSADKAEASLLVVDDDPFVLRLIDGNLIKAGYKTTCFTNSQRALEAFCADPQGFDLLITEQTMVSLTGAELAEAVLQIVPSMPIILCTGQSQTFSRDRALELGIKKYIHKPIAMGLLLEVVGELLGDDSPDV